MNTEAENIVGGKKSFGVALIRSQKQIVFWVLGLAALIGAVGWQSNQILDNAVSDAVNNSAVSTSERWAAFFGENMPRLESALAGKVDDEQIAYVRTIEKMGDVFRFKLFDKNARLVFISDEIDKLHDNSKVVEEEPHAQTVISTGQSNVEVVRDHNKKNRPPIYAEAYVPVKNSSGTIIGVAEVYVNQTLAEKQIRSSFLGLGMTLAGLVGLAVTIPGVAFIWRSRQALEASRKAAALEASNFEMEKMQSSELSVHNDKLVLLNRELADRMKELADAQDELVKRGRMEQLGQLTATVAHELRNPLGAVRTSAFLLERKLKDKGMNVDAQLSRINNGVVRCDNIITQLLDFSRSKHLQTIDADLDNWLVGVLEEEAKKLPTFVAVDCQLGLNSRAIPFDAPRLQRAIVNLINNASEAMVGQGDDPSKFTTDSPIITVRTSIEGEHAKIEVSDNGPGILPDVLLKIREPLFTTKSFGTGLGIPAIEQIATQHGGRLDIASEAGHGAVFTLFLPLKASVVDAELEAA